MKLYEITESMAGLQSLADTEELTPEMIADTMEGLQAEFSEKATAILQVRQRMMGEVAMIDVEIERLQALKKTPSNNADKLSEYLKANMLATETDKLELGLFKVTLKKAGVKLGEVREEFVPSEFFTVIPATQKLDRRALLAAAKAHHVDGVLLVDAERGLVIK